MPNTDPILTSMLLDPIRSYRVGSGSPMWVPGYLSGNLPRIRYEAAMDMRDARRRAIERANDDVRRQAWSQQYKEEQARKNQFFLDFEKRERERELREWRQKLQDDAQRRFPPAPIPQKNPFDNMPPTPGDPLPHERQPNWSDRNLSYAPSNLLRFMQPQRMYS